MDIRRARRAIAAFAAIALVTGVLAAGSAGASPTAGANSRAGDYIVVLHDSVERPGAVAREHARDQRAQVRFVYENALKGYAATLSEQGLRGVQRDSRVAYVEADGIATITHHLCGHDKPTPGDCTNVTTGTVAGTVTDSGTKAAIEGATVSVDGKSDTTDTTGAYTIEGVSAEDQEVTASAQGYDPQTRTVAVTDGGTAAADFALAASTIGDPPPPCDSQTLPWGIDRVEADLSTTVAGNCVGEISNVRVYVIDTGADTEHADLNVVGHVNFAGGPNKDCHGHGTHVAGTIAAKDNNQDVVGVAPGAPVTGVKVLGCSGSGSWSGVIAGVDWVTANAKKPAIANMSLGGGANQAVDDAVKDSAASGVVYSLSAGNSGANACESSPARAGEGTDNGIITVAATDEADHETSWSNYGSCVDIWAPGASILSTSKGGGTTTMSGTSMSAPHVGGAAALYLSTNTATGPGAIEGSLTGAADTLTTESKGGQEITLLDVGTF